MRLLNTKKGIIYALYPVFYVIFSFILFHLCIVYTPVLFINNSGQYTECSICTIYSLIWTDILLFSILCCWPIITITLWMAWKFKENLEQKRFIPAKLIKIRRSLEISFLLGAFFLENIHESIHIWCTFKSKYKIYCE